MSSAITVNGSRVLAPHEVYALRSVISKPSLLALFNLLLYTGMRLTEVKQLINNPKLFDEERKSILIKSTKKEAKQKTRNIILNQKGIDAVKEFLKNPYYPSSPFVWQKNLIRWCRAAHLEESKDYEYETNPYMITVRTTRKTWESWLVAAHEDKFIKIVSSQGHKESTAITCYIGYNFTEDEYHHICGEVSDWGMSWGTRNGRSA
jgi:integrase